MNKTTKNKRKIINDPVHGFVTIPCDLIFDLIENPFFQRLRRIRQLGLTHYVFPGATHTRFQHTIGALHLMSLSIESLLGKGISITPEEQEGAYAAILLHDIGHGPFSHALEETIIPGVSHEFLSHLIMNELNCQFNGQLDLAISIFNNQYHKKFLHQLVSSQLDMDRLDYIRRDSFYTGVTEGTIGTDRLIKMLNVYNDRLVVENKGIYSVEKFLISRRLMYWQVYFHKTVIAAETLLVRLLKRAKYLSTLKIPLYSTPSLGYFLDHPVNSETIASNTPEILEQFCLLDDNDIMVSAKQWQFHDDKVLSILANSLINRALPRVMIQDKPFPEAVIRDILKKISIEFNVENHEAEFMLSRGEISNNAFTGKDDLIQIYLNDEEGIRDVSEISNILNDLYLERPEKKYYLSVPRIHSPLQSVSVKNNT